MKAPDNHAAEKKKLIAQIAAARKQAENAKKTAKAAKTELKQAKLEFKEAKRAAKKSRKAIKALEASLATLTAKRPRSKKPVRKSSVSRTAAPATEPTADVAPVATGLPLVDPIILPE